MKRAFSRVAPPRRKDGGARPRDAGKSRIERNGTPAMGIGGARSVSEAGRLEASGAGGRRDGSSERVEGRWRIGWLKPFRPSKGDGHRAGGAGASGAAHEQRTARGTGTPLPF